MDEKGLRVSQDSAHIESESFVNIECYKIDLQTSEITKLFKDISLKKLECTE